ncbi:MAG: hypothetical protein ACRDHJ_11130, partial [Actinomycetota bacterium]
MLLATVLLVVGLIAGSGLALIYISIFLSLVAGVVLVVATRVGETGEEMPGFTPPQPVARQPVAREPVAAGVSWGGSPGGGWAAAEPEVAGPSP